MGEVKEKKKKVERMKKKGQELTKGNRLKWTREEGKRRK